MPNPNPDTSGLLIMARYKGVKPIKLTLDPEMIDFAKSKGNASAFTNQILKERAEREQLNLSLTPDGLNDLGEARDTINQLMKQNRELHSEITELLKRHANRLCP